MSHHLINGSNLLWARVYRLHWPIEKALTTPIKKMKAG